MNPILLRYVGVALAAVIAGAGGGYLAVNNTSQTAPSGTVSAIPAIPFPGQGIPAIPATPAVPGEKLAQTCPTVPYHKVYGVFRYREAASQPSDLQSLLDNNLRGNVVLPIATYDLLRLKSGALLAANAEFDDLVNGRYTKVRHLIYRSSDNGKNWSASPPLPATSFQKYPGQLAEGTDDTIYGAGFGLWKSDNGSINWKWLPLFIKADIGGNHPAGDYEAGFPFIRKVLTLKDSSVVVAIPFYPPQWLNVHYTAYTNVYRSTDGGSNWNLLFTYAGGDIWNIVELDDGSLVFPPYDNWSGKYTLGKFANGSLTQIEGTIPQGTRSYGLGPTLKTRDGRIYAETVREPAHVSLHGTKDYVIAIYSSTNGGKTWQLEGELPWYDLYQYLEGSDGMIYAGASYTPCWGGTVYKQGRNKQWEVFSGTPPSLSYFLYALAEVGGKILHAGTLNVVLSTP